MLVADVNVDDVKYDEKEFMAKLAELMYLYGVNRVTRSYHHTIRIRREWRKLSRRWKL